MNKLTAKKVALAYSGGLDTSIIIPWLKENYGCEVVAVCGDIGQGGEELEGLKEKALQTGASEVYVEDMREEFVSDYLWKLVRSGAVYEHKYLLGTSIARPLLAKRQAEVALKTGCDALAHGCTGKGNDQVRFELTYKAIAPHLPVIAPWREWNIVSREDAIEYAAAHKVPIAQSTTKIYSRDRNIWHISHEGGELEDPANAAPEQIWMLTKSPAEGPQQAAEVTIGFENGVPVSLNGQGHLSGVALLEQLNELGGKHGIGRIDLVENRFVGMKSRGCYETPGGTILMAAARELEALTLDRSTLHYKQKAALDYAEMVYNGLWFTPLREALDAFFAKVAEPVTGEVTMRLYKGNLQPVSRKSSNSLYSLDIASFTMGASYDQKDALGFINLIGLPIKVQASLTR
ncbi:MAG: argininosuccinate synthase [Acidobacteriaceae bacterium]|nr:argininosuccinate synthase [Acidobacteriaceae bacterium]MBV8569953.1 argininosuccinate synthase [Acidobacteriaceae bacterium]